MSAVKTSVNTDSSSLAKVNNNSHNPANVIQSPFVGSEKVATIDKLPRGTALHAARTPRSKESARTAPFSKQPTGNGASALTTSTPLVHSNSTSSINNSSEHEDVLSSESTEPEASTNNDPPRKASNGVDLARRAAHRVNVWKKSEQDRRGEEERARQVKLEHEKRRQNHAAHAKQRRRAEIYALNALLRQLQQEKVARYIAAQKQIQETQQQVDCQKEASLSETTAALAQVRTVGV